MTRGYQHRHRRTRPPNDQIGAQLGRVHLRESAGLHTGFREVWEFERERSPRELGGQASVVSEQLDDPSWFQDGMINSDIHEVVYRGAWVRVGHAFHGLRGSHDESDVPRG